jgi:hypothetical protein
MIAIPPSTRRVVILLTLEANNYSRIDFDIYQPSLNLVQHDHTPTHSLTFPPSLIRNIPHDLEPVPRTTSVLSSVARYTRASKHRHITPLFHSSRGLTTSETNPTLSPFPASTPPSLT